MVRLKQSKRDKKIVGGRYEDHRRSVLRSNAGRTEGRRHPPHHRPRARIAHERRVQPARRLRGRCGARRVRRVGRARPGGPVARRSSRGVLRVRSRGGEGRAEERGESGPRAGPRHRHARRRHRARPAVRPPAVRPDLPGSALCLRRHGGAGHGGGFGGARRGRPRRIVVYEHSLAGNDASALAAAELGFELASRKKYGDTTVDVLRAGERAASDND